MLERFKNYFGKLERLSDDELDRSAEKLVCAEKQKRKLERRKARQKATKAKPRPEEMSEDVVPGVEDEPARSRYVPSEAIERIHARGNHQCEYKMGRNSFSGRSMKGGGVGKCRSTGHRCLELHSERAFKERFRQSHIYGLRRAAEALGFTLTPDASGT